MSTGNSQQSPNIVSYNRFQDSESTHGRNIIGAIMDETAIDFENAQLLYYHRGHSSRRPLYAQEIEFCEALEARLAREKAERVDIRVLDSDRTRAARAKG